MSWLSQYGIVLPNNPGGTFQISVEVDVDEQPERKHLVAAARNLGIAETQEVRVSNIAQLY